MPIYKEERKIKLRCRSCGKEFTITVGGYGDNPKSLNELTNLSRAILRSKQGNKCPKCGSEDVEIVK